MDWIWRAVDDASRHIPESLKQVGSEPESPWHPSVMRHQCRLVYNENPTATIVTIAVMVYPVLHNPEQLDS